MAWTASLTNGTLSCEPCALSAAVKTRSASVPNRKNLQRSLGSRLRNGKYGAGHDVRPSEPSGTAKQLGQRDRTRRLRVPLTEPGCRRSNDRPGHPVECLREQRSALWPWHRISKRIADPSAPRTGARPRRSAGRAPGPGDSGAIPTARTASERQGQGQGQGQGHAEWPAPMAPEVGPLPWLAGPAEIGGEGFGGGKTIGRDPGQCSLDRRLQCGRQPRPNHGQPGWRIKELTREDALNRPSGEWRLPAEHLIERRSPGRRYRSGRRCLVAAPLLRTHVLRRPDREPARSQRLLVRRRKCARAIAEVRDAWPVRHDEQDVGRLDVAMNHVVRVGIGQGVGDLPGDPDRRPPRATASPA